VSLTPKRYKTAPGGAKNARPRSKDGFETHTYISLGSLRLHCFFLKVLAACANFPPARGYPKRGFARAKTLRTPSPEVVISTEGRNLSWFGFPRSDGPLRLCARYSESGWLHLCVVKNPVVLIDEFNQSLDGLQFWIHGDFGKIEIFGHKKLISARGSIRDPIQRCS
jgi:hypothetical protein